jgi:ribA/ribD-fused uncharacterized protein
MLGWDSDYCLGTGQPLYGNNPVLIRKVKDEHGWLGNMSPYPIVWEGKKYRTTEALFQALRFDDEDIIEEIREQKSPMAAKFVAKKHKKKMVSPEDKRDKDLENMRLCLKLKLEQHPDLKEKLKATHGEKIIEDCSNRLNKSGLFWGAAFIKETWIGANALGKLWMELRMELIEEEAKKIDLGRHKCHGTWKPYSSFLCSSCISREDVEEEIRPKR